MFDVESITFPEYIDSELIASDKYLKSSLVSYIKSSSDLSSYKVSVKLRFYVK
jgi:hypothetical protein